MRVKLISVLFAATLATGCANFQAAKDFSAQGGSVTDSVSAEFVFLKKNCDETVTTSVALKVSAKAIEDRKKSCAAMESALAKLAEHTLDLFGKYNKAIETLADGSKYDLSASFKTTADKLKALKDKDGAIIKGESVDVGLKAANLLADIVTQTIRARELKALLAAGGEDWPKVMSPLKTFFGPHPSNPDAWPSPYQIYSRALQETFKLMEADVKAAWECKSSAVQCEPLWAGERLPQISARISAFDKRKSSDDAKPSETALAIHKAIDAWLAALQKLRAEAADPDAEQVIASLRNLKSKADELKAAIAANAK